MSHFRANFRSYAKPYWYFFSITGLNGLQTSRLYKVYVVLFMTASISLYVLPNVVYTEVFEGVVMSLKVMNQLVTVFMVLGHTSAILSINFVNRRHLGRFLEICMKSRAYFDRNVAVRKKGVAKYAIFGSMHLGIIAILIYEACLYLNPLKPMIWFMAGHILQYSYIVFATLLIVSVNLIRANIIDLRKGLAGTVSAFKRNNSSSEHRKFKELNAVFIDVARSVEHFNSTFSWPILAAVLYVICDALQTVGCTIFGISSLRKHGIDSHYLVVMGAWTALILATCFIFTSSANATTRECENFSRLCYKLTHDFDENARRSPFREELIELAEFSFTKLPKFTAAGFFDVDYTMLYRMMTMFTAYLIVLIQFHS